MSLFDSKRPIDLISMGRVAVDLYAEQVGSHLEDVQTFRKYLGGCAGNIAVGTARLGLNSAILSCVGTDAMGQFLMRELQKNHVDVSHVYQTDDHLTSLVTLGIKPPTNFPMIYYRDNCADMQLKPEHCDKKFFVKAKGLFVTGTGLSKKSIRETTHFAVDLAMSTKTAVILDLDFRPVLWNLVPKGEGQLRFKASKEVTKHYQALLPKCTLILGTPNEICVAGGSENLTEALNNIRAATDAIIVINSLDFGCKIYSDDINQAQHFPGYPVRVFNSQGSSDVFIGGLLAGWLAGESWQKAAQLANACEAIVVTRHSCAPAIPCRDEVDYFIEKYTTDPNVSYQEKLNHIHRRCSRSGPDQLFVLSFDHDYPFDQSCDDVGRERNIIKAFKHQVYQGFVQLKNTHPELNLGISVDPEYCKEIISDANNMRIRIALPIDAGGSFPVQWYDRRPLYEQILERPSNFCVKIRWQYHPNFEATEKLRQLSQLRLLSQVCERLNRKLVVELAMPADYNRNGKYMAKAMTQVYEHDIYPYCWKLLPQFTYSDWQLVNEVCEKFDPSVKIILLGGNYKQYEDWTAHFALFKKSKFAHGFTIGRSTFWEAWQQVLSGEISLDDVPKIVSDNFQSFLDCWFSSEKTAELVT